MRNGDNNFSKDLTCLRTQEKRNLVVSSHLCCQHVFCLKAIKAQIWSHCFLPAARTKCYETLKPMQKKGKNKKILSFSLPRDHDHASWANEVAAGHDTWATKHLISMKLDTRDL